MLPATLSPSDFQSPESRAFHFLVGQASLLPGSPAPWLTSLTQKTLPSNIEVPRALLSPLCTCSLSHICFLPSVNSMVSVLSGSSCPTVLQSPNDSPAALTSFLSFRLTYPSSYKTSPLGSSRDSSNPTDLQAELSISHPLPLSLQLSPIKVINTATQI